MKKMTCTLLTISMILIVFSSNTIVKADGYDLNSKDLIQKLYYPDYNDDEFDLLYTKYTEKYGKQDVMIEDILNTSVYAVDIPTDYSSYFENSYFYNRDDGLTLGVWWSNFLFKDSNNRNLLMAKASKAWIALENKHKSDSRWDNGESMEAQFHCHVTTIGSWKKPWNLEPWRTETDFVACTSAGCNP